MTSQRLHGDHIPVEGPLDPRRGWREGCWLPVRPLGPDVGRGCALGGRAVQASPRLGLGSPGLALSLPAAWPRYRVVGSAEAGQYNLEITDAELSDDASYECQATEAALRSRRAKLTVLSNNPQHPACTPPPPSPPRHLLLSLSLGVLAVPRFPSVHLHFPVLFDPGLMYCPDYLPCFPSPNPLNSFQSQVQIEEKKMGTWAPIQDTWAV